MYLKIYFLTPSQVNGMKDYFALVKKNCQIITDTLNCYMYVGWCNLHTTFQLHLIRLMSIKHARNETLTWSGYSIQMM